MKRLIIFLWPLALFAQPQSPNFVLQRETVCAVAARDSLQNYILRSIVAQTSDAGVLSSVNFVIKSGFLAPVFTSAAPEIDIDPDTVDFGNVWINMAVEEIITLQNTGNADLIVDSVHSGHPLIPSLTTPLTLPAGESQAIPLIVTAPDTLSYEGYMTAYSNAGRDSVFVTASGIWTELAAEPNFVDFGTCSVGDSLDTLVTLASTGNVAVVVTGFDFTNDMFTLFGPPLDTIEAHQSTFLGIRFRAEFGGIFRDTLVIANNVGSPVRIPLSAGVTSASESALIPSEFMLDQNYPNPFNPSTSIRFGLPHISEISLRVFDMLGRDVITLAQGRYDAGFHVVTWSCEECPTGLYFVRMQSSNFVATRKILMLK